MDGSLSGCLSSHPSTLGDLKGRRTEKKEKAHSPHLPNLISQIPSSSFFRDVITQHAPKRPSAPAYTARRLSLTQIHLEGLYVTDITLYSILSRDSDMCRDLSVTAHSLFISTRCLLPL